MLLALASGVVDAISLITLGVFTAAVTANVVLVGIAIGDADAHTALRAGLAIAGFVVGVLGAARVLGGGEGIETRPARAPAVLGAIAAAQVVFLIVWLAADGRPDGAALDVLTLASALAMGGQTAAARTWHAGITTTYVSGTLTLLLSELAVAGGSRSEHRRMLSVIAAVAAGATVGALLLAHAREPAALVPLLLTLIVAAGAATILRRRPDRDSLRGPAA